MNETQRSNSRLTAAALPIGLIIGLIIGVLIGLLLGWLVWPVEWEGGTLEVLSAGAKTDVLRGYIDAYAYRPDDTLALVRYNSLGEQKEALLSQVWNDPEPQTVQDIESFAAAVGASAAINAAPEAVAQEPTALSQLMGRSALTIAGTCLSISLLLILIIGVILTAGRRSRTPRPAPASPVARSETTATEPVPADSRLIATAEGESAAEPDLDEMPAWLRPSPGETSAGASAEDPYHTVRLEEQSFAQVFELEQEQAPDPGATPPRGLYFPPEEGEPADTIAAEDELSDADIEAITGEALPGETISADDFTTRREAAQTAFIDETFAEGFSAVEGFADPEVQAEETTALDDFAWLDEVPAEGKDQDDWLEPTAADSEPTQAEIAPLEMETPVAIDTSEWTTAEPAEEVAFEEVEGEETPEETYAKFSRDIAYLTEIDPDNAEKLRAIGITVPLLLLHRGATANGRSQIAAETGLGEDQILRWVNYVDLFRVKGVTQEFAELLEAVGIATVSELAGSDEKDLHAMLRKAAAGNPMVSRVPARGMVESWVAQAKKLPRSVS